MSIDLSLSGCRGRRDGRARAWSDACNPLPDPYPPMPSGSGRQAFYSASAPPRRPSLDLHGFLKVGRVLPLPGHGGPVRWSPAPPWFLRAGAGARRDFSIGRLGRSGGSLDPALPPVGVGTCRVGVNVGQPSCNVIIVEESCVRAPTVDRRSPSESSSFRLVDGTMDPITSHGETLAGRIAVVWGSLIL